MKAYYKKLIFISFIVLIVFILISLAKVTLNARDARNSFREEMAQRLDLEEKIAKMEKRQAVLLSELNTLQVQLLRSKEEIDLLKGRLVKTEEEKVVLKSTLEKIKEQLSAFSVNTLPVS